MTLPSLKAVIVLAGALALSACAGASTRFYTIDALASPGAPVSGYTGPPFRIDAVHIPPAFDRPELVRQTFGERFTVSDNDHWAAPLGELIRRALTQDVEARFPGGKVVFPDAPKPPGTAGLVVDILAITPSGGEVTMDVSWTLIGAKPDAATVAPARLQRTLRLKTPQGGGVQGEAAELSDLTRQLADSIATGLQ